VCVEADAFVAGEFVEAGEVELAGGLDVVSGVGDE